MDVGIGGFLYYLFVTVAWILPMTHLHMSIVPPITARRLYRQLVRLSCLAIQLILRPTLLLQHSVQTASLRTYIKNSAFSAYTPLRTLQTLCSYQILVCIEPTTRLIDYWQNGVSLLDPQTAYIDYITPSYKRVLTARVSISIDCWHGDITPTTDIYRGSFIALPR